ncbi:MAG: hypothetical protein ACXWDU_09285, partial [Actinomycetota bacterium]
MLPISPKTVSQLDLDGDDTAVIAFDDQVRLVVTAVGSEVPNGRVPGLRTHPKRQRDQGLEQRTQEGAGVPDGVAALATEQPDPWALTCFIESAIFTAVVKQRELVKLAGKFEAEALRILREIPGL